MWGNKPWDNDRAADWFAKLMENTKLPAEVRQTLQLSSEENYDEENTPLLRAAIYCILQFGHVYVWPVNDLENDLKLAIEAAGKVLEDEEYCYSEEVTDMVRQELEELKKRLNKISK
jgi:hypothetical protein